MTIADFAVKVMQKMGVWDIAKTLSAEDLTNVTDAYNTIYLQLKDDSLVTWGSTEDIPTRFVLPLTVMVAAEIGDFYLVPEQQLQRFILQAGIAEKTIRKQLASGQDPDRVTAEYF